MYGVWRTADSSQHDHLCNSSLYYSNVAQAANEMGKEKKNFTTASVQKYNNLTPKK